jgi:E3 ubiquitin-protein ligase HECTD1
VLITASSPYYEPAFSVPKTVADLNFDSAFATGDEPGSWICWDFKEKRVVPTDYSIGSASKGMVQHFNLRRWVVEGSVNGSTWTVLDKQDENNELTAKPVTRTYPARGRDELQFIRLRQTGKNNNGSDNLAISFFEVFGSLLE